MAWIAYIAAAALGMAAGIAVMLFPGLDGSAALGAWAGASLFAMRARVRSVYQRGLYLLVSWSVGYMATPDLMYYAPTTHSGPVAFVAALLVVSLSIGLIEAARHLDLDVLLQKTSRIFKPRSNKK